MGLDVRDLFLFIININISGKSKPQDNNLVGHVYRSTETSWGLVIAHCGIPAQMKLILYSKC